MTKSRETLIEQSIIEQLEAMIVDFASEESLENQAGIQSDAGRRVPSNGVIAEELAGRDIYEQFNLG
ncbi:MAG: hypothetical protein VX686_04175 [Candidatus Thermoplasmatota archaeon]|nr:hypothetical protein [Candidatus Thermoplasmatota archaeon]